MEKYTRFCLCLFPMGENNTQTDYDNNRRSLYQSIEEIQKSMINCEDQISFYTYCPYDKAHFLSSFTIGKHIFLGLYNKKTGVIDFADENGNFSSISEYSFGLLETNMKRLIKNGETSRVAPFVGEHVFSAWLDTLPLLHAVILYENYIDKYEPQARSNGTYDAVINTLVDTYETYREDGLTMEGLYLAIEGNVPSFTRAWELYTKDHNPELEAIDQKILLTYPKLAEQKEMFQKAYPEYANNHLYFGFSLDEESEFILLDKDADIVAEVFISDNGQFELLSCLEEDIEVPTTEDGPEL